MKVLKRAIFAVLDVTLTGSAVIQCLCAQTVIVICTVVHFICLPFIYGGLDKLDCLYLISLMAFSLFGMGFSLFSEYDDSGEELYAGLIPRKANQQSKLFFPREDLLACIRLQSICMQAIRMAERPSDTGITPFGWVCICHHNSGCAERNPQEILVAKGTGTLCRKGSLDAGAKHCTECIRHAEAEAD